MDNPKYKMSIDLNVLNHLGLNLYSNVPAVLSEVVANSWDADATNVKIDIDVEKEKITITDDGHGMSEAELNAKYLKVGYERRKKEPGCTPKQNRPVMGRKGIGKLSLFSIAETVEVQTFNSEKKNGFMMSVAKIREAIEQGGSSYHPESLSESDVALDQQGTRIVLTGLKKGVAQAPNALRKRLARRFSVIGNDDFNVTINGESVTVTDRDYFHKLQYLWHFGDKSEQYVKLCKRFKSHKLEHAEKREGDIEVPGEGDAQNNIYPVRGWIGTVLGSGDLRDEDEGDNLNKIVIMVRGKLAQEDILEEFPEGGLYTKYLIGEIHADFLDRDEELDIATSNRQAIIKDDPRYEGLREWVNDELKNIQSQWTNLRTEEGTRKAMQIPAINDWVQHLAKGTQRQAKSLLGKIGQLTLDPKDKVDLYKHSVLAFESLRYKGSLDKLEGYRPKISKPLPMFSPSWTILRHHCTTRLFKRG